MSDYFQLMSADGDRTVTRGNYPPPIKLSVNHWRTNTQEKNFLANVLAKFGTVYHQVL